MIDASYSYLIFGVPLIIIYLIRKYSLKVPKGINENVFVKKLNDFNPESLIDQKLYKKIPNAVEIKSSENFMDFATNNFLNIYDNQTHKTNAEQCIRTYGVGSCGPRGFYGTMDIHLEVENKIAKFMGLEETVLYSYGYSTVASAIPAYCRKSDIIFCDEEISFPAKQGFVAARSNIIYFKHNDMNDLEEKLQQHQEKERKLKRNFRKFLVVEGIYQNTGRVCPLPELITLREKYKLRMFLDESVSIGVLGETGRGISEHFKKDRADIDMFIGSLEHSLSSIGGFCVGSSVIIEHQRLSGLGYCFSASLPPFLCQSAIDALETIENEPERLIKLKEMSCYAQDIFNNIPGYLLLSDAISPIKVLQITFLPEKADDSIKQIIQKIYDGEITFNVNEEQNRICLKIKINHTEENIQKAAQILAEARYNFTA